MPDRFSRNMDAFFKDSSGTGQARLVRIQDAAAEEDMGPLHAALQAGVSFRVRHVEGVPTASWGQGVCSGETVWTALVTAARAVQGLGPPAEPYLPGPLDEAVRDGWALCVSKGELIEVEVEFRQTMPPREVRSGGRSQRFSDTLVRRGIGERLPEALRNALESDPITRTSRLL